MFWEGRFNMGNSPESSFKVIPNGYLETIIHLSDAHCELIQEGQFARSPRRILIGMYTQPYEVHFREMVPVFGIRFKPEGLLPILGSPAAEIGEGYISMAALLGREFQELCDRLRETPRTRQRISLVEGFLQQKLSRKKHQIYYLHRAAEVIRQHKGQITVEELAARVFISKRQLEREFKQHIGVTPKQYIRLTRLNAVNHLLEVGHPLSLTNLAHEFGYADQAHFIREFKHFTGQKPTVFLRERDQYIVNAHVGKPA